MSRASNNAYLRKLADQLIGVPERYAAEVATRIFEKVVWATRIDSGQAAANWRLEPYTGTTDMQPQVMMWGYRDVSPIPPVGYKWDKGRNAETIRTTLVEQRLVQTDALAGQKFDGIAVYNPISPGFAGFFPFSDEKYEEYAFDEVRGQINSIISDSVNEAEAYMVSNYHFLKRM